MKKFLTTLHRWLGFPLGIVFVITFFTGFLTAIDEFITRAEQSFENQKYTWQHTTNESNAEAIEYFIAEHKSIRQIYMPTHQSPYYRVAARGESWIYPIDFLGSDKVLEPFYLQINQDGFFKTVLQLHRNLLLGKEGLFTVQGKYYVAWTGLISLFISLLGLWLWWPRRNTFKVKDIVPRGAKRKHFYLSHMTSGVIVLVAIVLLSLTGASISYRAVTQQLFGIERDRTFAMQPIKVVNTWQAWLTDAYSHMPAGAELQQIRFPRQQRAARQQIVKEKSQSKARSIKEIKPDQIFEFRFYSQGDWLNIASSKVFIKRYASELVNISLFSQLPLGNKVYSILKPLHTGHDLPFFYVLLQLFFSFVGGAMVFSGVFSFLIKNRKKASGFIKKRLRISSSNNVPTSK